MEYNSEQRKAKIVELLNENGEVKVSALSKLFGTSEVTIRFDLEALEGEGLLSRVYGGAVSSGKLYHEMDLKQRYAANEAEKKAIAEKIASMINSNDTIMMNAGTTLTYVLRAIKNSSRKKKNLTLVTNSVQAALEASSYPVFHVILLGGYIDSKYQYTYGADTIAQLSGYHADKLILSVDGINCEAGYTLFYSQETEVTRAMIRHAATTIIAADCTKIGRIAFANVAPLESADYIVTNEAAPRDYVESIRELGVNVTLA